MKTKSYVITSFNYGIFSLFAFLQDIIWNLSKLGSRGDERIIYIPEFLEIPIVEDSIIFGGLSARGDSLKE